MAARLFKTMLAAGHGIYCGLGRTVVALRLWNCQWEIERLETRRRNLDARSRSTILMRVHLNQLADHSFTRSPVTPLRGSAPVLVRSMGRVVNG